MKETTADVVIVGLGAMGSAAAYQLSKTDKRVIGIDRFSPPHVEGSSHGETRITRQAIGEGKHFVPLVLRANEIWKELEKETNTKLLTQCGGLFFAKDPDGTPSHSTTSFLRETIEAAKAYSIQHEVLSNSEMASRFPAFHFSTEETGYFEPGAGYLSPEKCIAAQLERAQENGVEMRLNSEVLSLVPTSINDEVEVVLENEKIIAKRCILSAGARLHRFLPEQHHPYFRIYRQVLYWFEEQPTNAHPMPVYIHLGAREEEMFYGFPSINGEIKVATEQLEQTTDPEKLIKTVSEDEIAFMYSLAGKHLPITQNCLRAACCMYTVTPDHNFVIDRLPEHPQIVVCSSCSGHGFKHSAAIGEVLKELACDETPSIDISAFAFR